MDFSRPREAVPFSDQGRVNWERIFNVNVFGLMGFMKVELRQIEK